MAPSSFFIAHSLRWVRFPRLLSHEAIQFFEYDCRIRVEIPTAVSMRRQHQTPGPESLQAIPRLSFKRNQRLPVLAKHRWEATQSTTRPAGANAVALVSRVE